jgi:glutamine synthetase
MSEEQRASIGIESLPGTLEEAIAELEKDSLVREALGDHIFSYYVHAKKKEWDDYRVRVNQWEIDNYLDRY